MKLAIIGAGTVGAALTKVLCAQDSVTKVVLLDKNGFALNELTNEIKSSKLRTHKVGIEQQLAVSGLIKGFDCLISALPYEYNRRITRLAIKNGINYLDFGANDATFEKQKELHEAAKAKEIFALPNCGLAPGLVNIVAMQAFKVFDKVDSIRMRSAGLPLDPIPPLNYQLSFSPAGLVNEYLGDTFILENGKLTNVKALDGHETVIFKSMPELGELESFYTSGQSATLAKLLEGKVDKLEFKTLRYPGHRNIIKSLFDLGFDSDSLIDIRSSMTYKKLLIRQLLRNLPQSPTDIALTKIKVIGEKDGKQIEKVYEIVEKHNDELNISGLMYSTALPTLVVAELIKQKKLGNNYGVFAPEEVVPGDEFLEGLKSKGLNITITESELA